MSVSSVPFPKSSRLNSQLASHPSVPSSEGPSCFTGSFLQVHVGLVFHAPPPASLIGNSLCLCANSFEEERPGPRTVRKAKDAFRFNGWYT